MLQSHNLKLDYLAPGQAQKHVSVNETFHKLDEIVQLNLQSRITPMPPAEPVSGDRYIVPEGQSGD